MKKMLLLALIALFFMASSASAETVCGIYFTKIGCPVCSKVDPVILDQWISSRNDAVVIEYVMDSWYEPHAVLMGEYNLVHGTGSSVPLMIKNANETWAGIPAFYTNDHIFQHAEEFFKDDKGECLLAEGEISFEELNLNDLPEKPKLWAGKRLLAKTGIAEIESDFLKELLFKEDLTTVLAGTQYELKEVKAEPAPYSGGEIPFAQAIDIGSGWVLKLKEAIELPENVEQLQNEGNGNGINDNGENSGDGNAAEANPFVFPVIAMISCVVALIVFIKVKKK